MALVESGEAARGVSEGRMQALHYQVMVVKLDRRHTLGPIAEREGDEQQLQTVFM